MQSYTYQVPFLHGNPFPHRFPSVSEAAFYLLLPAASCLLPHLLFVVFYQMQFFIFSCFVLILFCFALLIVLLSDPLFPRLSPSPFFILTCSSQDCAPFAHGLFVLIVAGTFSHTSYIIFLSLLPFSSVLGPLIL